MRVPADYHALAGELVEYACGGPSGRGENDPVYQAVTEGRDVGAMQRRYSSCADLAHWMLYRLGVRFDWLNRAEHRGWTSGVNVSRLAFNSGLAEVDPKPTSRYLTGDIGIIWGRQDTADAHVFVILDDEQPAALLVAEYGQPGGRVNARRIGYWDRQLVIGVKALHRVIRLERVLDEADALGLLAPPEPMISWATRLKLPLPTRVPDTEPAPPPAPSAPPENIA